MPALIVSQLTNDAQGVAAQLLPFWRGLFAESPDCLPHCLPHGVLQSCADVEKIKESTALQPPTRFAGGRESTNGGKADMASASQNVCF
jgi:hypothetical protein